MAMTERGNHAIMGFQTYSLIPLYGTDRAQVLGEDMEETAVDVLVDLRRSGALCPRREGRFSLWYTKGTWKTASSQTMVTVTI